MTDRYEKIRRALEMGLTPGPWFDVHHEGSRWTDIFQDGDRRYATPVVYVPPLSVLVGNDVWKESKDETVANAKHVAACDPDTIRELLAERDQLAAALEAAREDAERYRWLRDREIPEWLDLWHQNPDRIDAAIDAAMEGEK